MNLEVMLNLFQHLMLFRKLVLKQVQYKFGITFICILFASAFCYSQNEDSFGKLTYHQEDSSLAKFGKYHVNVAKAQIQALKNGALLVRLKTNSNTINRLKAAGNIDLATQVERETYLNNKAIVRAYIKEFNFCPVYFFNSEFSDSVKHKKLATIFVDSNLVINTSIVCNAAFYLVAEQGSIYNSSLGLVTEAQAPRAVERGTPSKEVFMVVKNRYFIQLHKPFPYYEQGYSIKKYNDYVKKFNTSLLDFHKKNSSYIVTPEIKEYIY